MNKFASTNTAGYNLKESYPDVGKALKDRRLKLADSKLGVIRDQLGDTSRQEVKSRNLTED